MVHLIDKDALVVEIKTRIETYNKGYANGDDCRADALETFLYDIDTLEVKEVDLEKEIKSFTMSKELYEADSAIKAVAEHFFELGINTKNE